MEDLLKLSALAYVELVPYPYHFAIGRKGQLYHMSIEFPEVAYHHLAGFHKIGISALSNKKSSLKTVLSGVVTHAHFIKAGVTLEYRWMGICRLKEIIESNRMIFFYRGHEQPGSMVKGDYLMTHEGIAFFIVNETPESIFKSEDRRYEAGCPRFTTLEICRVKKSSGETVCLYRSPNFQETIP